MARVCSGLFHPLFRCSPLPPMTGGRIPDSGKCLRKMADCNHIWVTVTVFGRGNTILEHPSQTWQAGMTICSFSFTSYQSLVYWDKCYQRNLINQILIWMFKSFTKKGGCIFFCHKILSFPLIWCKAVKYVWKNPKGAKQVWQISFLQEFKAK